MENSCLPPLPKKKTYFINDSHAQLHIPVYIREYNIYFTNYTKDINNKVSKIHHFFINKICYHGSSFDT